MIAANAGPRRPGKWVVVDPGATRAPLSRRGTQKAHEIPYARTKKETVGKRRMKVSMTPPAFAA
jgi:hypothetical protein